MKKAAKLAKTAKTVAACLAGAVVLTIAVLAVLGMSGTFDEEIDPEMIFCYPDVYTGGRKVTAMGFVGDVLYYSDGIGGIFRYNAENDESEFIGQTEGNHGGAVLFDGENVIYGWKNTVYRFNVRTAENVALAVIEYPPAEVAALPAGWQRREWYIARDERDGGINVCFWINYPMAETPGDGHKYVYYRLDTETGGLTLTDVPPRPDYAAENELFNDLAGEVTDRFWNRRWETYRDNPTGGICFNAADYKDYEMWYYTAYPFTADSTVRITELDGLHKEPLFTYAVLVDAENCRVAIHDNAADRFLIYDAPSLKGESS